MTYGYIIEEVFTVRILYFEVYFIFKCFNCYYNLVIIYNIGLLLQFGSYVLSYPLIFCENPAVGTYPYNPR